MIGLGMGLGPGLRLGLSESLGSFPGLAGSDGI